MTTWSPGTNLVTFAPTVFFPTKYFGKTAKHSFGGAITTKKYTPFDSIKQVVIPGPPLNPVQPKRGSWSGNYTFRQYLVERGRKDGWGFFSQVSFADKATSPITTFFDLGLGGNGLFKSRPRDEFGIAYAYTDLSSVLKDNIDLLAISAHKIYGPKGVGALYVRRRNPRVQLSAIIDGGGHERGMRSGTLNVPGIVGLGAACEIAQKEMAEESVRLAKLRDRLKAGLEAKLDEVFINGSLEHRLPNNLNMSFAYVEGESLLMGINDIAVSSGSACTSATLEPSYVLKALGVGEDLAHTSIRFGLGRFNTEEEVDYVTDKMVQVVTKLRELSPLYEMAKEGIDISKVNWQTA